MPTFTKTQKGHEPHSSVSSESTSTLLQGLGPRRRKPLNHYLYLLNKRIREEAGELGNLYEEEVLLIEEILQQIIRLVELPLRTVSLDEIPQKLEELLVKHEFRAKNQFSFSLLTPREKEVLTKLATGLSNKEVADLLFISLDTVKHHRKLIKSKLNASSTADLIKYAQAFDLK